jgi:PIN domain nuclease of toxin-antitoxin system
MNRYLVDTTIFLYWLTQRNKLSNEAYAVLINRDNAIYISAATIWEVDIKRGLGEVVLDNIDIASEMEESEFHKLEVSSKAAKIAKSLPAKHTDPFNRTIIAQAIHNNLVLITRDESMLTFDAIKTIKG